MINPKYACTLKIGSVLYEASKTCNCVFEWKVVDIYMEACVSGWNTMFLIERESDSGMKIREERFSSDIYTAFYDSRMAAEYYMTSVGERSLCKW